MRSPIRPLAATVLVAAAGLVWAPSPAAASVCGDDSGVTVVVDFNELGGGVQTACVADRGQADELFRDAGHTLANVQGQAFVCRVDGLPTQEQEACVRTPPADAYWGLFWSDGESGTWTYSSSGAYSLDVPDGGAVGFAWQGSTTKTAPGVAPPRHEADPEPTEQPTQQPTQQPQPSPPPSSGGGEAGTPSAAPTSSAPASGRGSDRGDRSDRPRDERQDRGETRPGKQDRDRPTDAPEESPGTPATDPAAGAAETAEPPASASDEGLPVWVGPAAVGGLFAVAGLAAYLRRRAA